MIPALTAAVVPTRPKRDLLLALDDDRALFHFLLSADQIQAMVRAKAMILEISLRTESSFGPGVASHRKCNQIRINQCSSITTATCCVRLPVAATVPLTPFLVAVRRALSFCDPLAFQTVCYGMARATVHYTDGDPRSI